MIDSPLHELISEIRCRFSGKKASIVDIRNIENTYKLCSFVNTRNDNCAFLRITSFGCGEVVFEDLVLNLDLIKKIESHDELMFAINKILFENAYGVILIDSDKQLLNYPIEKPTFDFQTINEEIEKLRKRCLELENKTSNNKEQISLFDFNE